MDNNKAELIGKAKKKKSFDLLIFSVLQFHLHNASKQFSLIQQTTLFEEEEEEENMKNIR